ncbi:acyl carrier protein [Streptomyces sp. NPDC047860]|uniref:acyl carrier protein n=1 Tax=Streptomyces sp. NPDC047860 TaxID=3155743 RepID=UPI0033EBA5B3
MSTPPADPPAASDLAATTRAVTDLWSEQLGVAGIRPDEDFFDLGGHSLIAVEIINQIERIFGVSISLRIFYQDPTVSGVVRALTADASRQN